ncbi:MAG: Transcription elongation factor GreA [Anaerolineae bacterium]|nr:MAG: Transcription elongation factor GreA [Anaerolineae bacterium]
MSETPILTAEGAAKLKAELEYLTTVARKEIAERLRHAVSQGDLSENADYHHAKEAQAFLEGRIQELEYLLKNATIVESNNGPAEEVQVGVRVTVQEEHYPPETYLIVGAKEADPRNGKISHESPIGSALLGHRVGEVVTAVTPNGKITLKILKIE